MIIAARKLGGACTAASDSTSKPINRMPGEPLLRSSCSLLVALFTLTFALVYSVVTASDTVALGTC